jgi:hypothetical protein
MREKVQCSPLLNKYRLLSPSVLEIPLSTATRLRLTFHDAMYCLSNMYWDTKLLGMNGVRCGGEGFIVNEKEGATKEVRHEKRHY